MVTRKVDRKELEWTDAYAAVNKERYCEATSLGWEGEGVTLCKLKKSFRNCSYGICAL